MTVDASRTPSSTGNTNGDVVIRRLSSLGSCSPALAEEATAALAGRVERVNAKVVLQGEGEAVLRPRFLLTGWACRFRHLPDGRRQIFDVVLPGEGVGVCLRPHPVAAASTITLTPVILADASRLVGLETVGASPELKRLLDAAHGQDEHRLLNALVRLGRLTALERLAHFLLELHGRLGEVGLVRDDRFDLPLTQETLSDLLGLSVVHINRTLMELRRQRLVLLARGEAYLPDLDALRDIAACSA